MASKWPSHGHCGATTRSPDDHGMVTAQPSSPHRRGHSRRCCRIATQPLQPLTAIPASSSSFPSLAPRGLPEGSQRAPGGPVVLQGPAALIPRGTFPQEPRAGAMAPLAQEHRREICPARPPRHTPALHGWHWLAHANASTTGASGHVRLEVHLDTWFPAQTPQVEAPQTPSINEAAQECSQSSGLPGQGSFRIWPLTGRAGTCPRG